MSLWRIALRSITQRSVASLLTIFSMALGVMLVVAVLSIHGVVEQSFANNASLGYNMIIGPKGGKEQLVLNTVYYLSSPVENIWASYYAEFLPQEAREKLLQNSYAAQSHEAAWQTAELAALAGDQGMAGAALALALEGAGLPLAPDARKKITDGPPVELGRNGQFGLMVEMAIPLCLGDYYGSYRVVGTTPALFDDLVYDLENDRKYEFAQGRNFVHHSPEHSYFEAVVGAKVARAIELDVLELRLQDEVDPAVVRALLDKYVNTSRIEADGQRLLVTLGQGVVEGDLALPFRRLDKEVREGKQSLTPAETAALATLLDPATIARRSTRKLQLGDQIAPAHGSPTGHTHQRKFTVVGILASSGTPNDRAVFVNMEGFYLMEDHAKPLDETLLGETDENGEEQQLSDEELRARYLAKQKKEWELLRAADPEPLPVEQREVTAVLIKTSPMIAAGLENAVNEGSYGQAVLPVAIIYNLFEFIVRPIQWTLLALTAMICVVSGISILVSIYNSMSERRQEIAVMRALGAGRGTVLWIILLESVLLSLAGGLVGWLLGHGLGALASPMIEDQTGVTIGFFHFEPRVDLLALLRLGTGPAIPLELVLLPALLLLAMLVGMWPAISAYRTDVARSLGK
jgi:ABC-type antimicrobial peptide transport system permease subunit